MHRRLFTSRTPEGGLRRKIMLARTAILLERFWQATFVPLMLAGTVLLLILSGALAMLPDWPRITLLVILLTAFIVSLRPLLRLRIASRKEALKRIEAASGLSHQPLRSLHDVPLTAAENARGRHLWRAHLTRLQAHIARLRVGWPRSALPQRDPYALRFALALALLSTLALQGPHWRQNLQASLRLPAFPGAHAPARLNAWLDPPPFLHRPPQVLSANGRPLYQDGQTIEVVQGTRLMIFADSSTARLHLRFEGDSRTREMAFAKADGKAWQLQLALVRSVHVTIPAWGISWRFRVVPDAAPTVTLTAPPAFTANGALVLRWQARDDHGVRSVRMHVSLVRQEPGMLAFKPPTAQLRVFSPAPVVKGRDVVNLAAHPWAGMKVKLRLKVEDVAGQRAFSPAYEFTLPERSFTRLLARAIIEQRKVLITHPAQAPQVAEMLAAFLAWPVGIIENPGVYLGLRLAMARLLAARTEAEKKSVVSLLWEIATDVEDGDLSAAKKRLQAARQALKEALEQGATEKEIARRVAELKRALNDFLRQLARRRVSPSPPLSRRGNARIISERQLRQMMRRLAELARSGARDAARRLLSRLDDILQNLQTAPQMASPPGPQERALSALRRLMRAQRKLMDETWKRALPPPSRSEQGHPPRGQNMRDLQMRQQALREQLQQLRENLQRQAGRASDRLGKAQRFMEEAAQALARGHGGKALSAQRNVMQALRKGAARLARQIARRRSAQASGMAGTPAPRYDPLGRPALGRDAGSDQPLLPNENATRRARRILEYLRRKAAEAGRPPVEHDYLKRLLRDLY